MEKNMVKTIVLAFVFAAAVLAQTPAPKTSTGNAADAAQFGPIGITAAMAGPASTISGAPYSADAVTERVQVLADGNRIRQTTTGTVARDSQGRVRRDESLPALSAGAEAPHLVTIMDPIAHVHWTLDPRSKTAMKMRLGAITPDFGPFMPPPPGADKTWFVANGSGAPQVQIFTRAEAPTDRNVTKIDVGTQTIEGVQAQGTRTTRTLPAGAVGNEQPLVITTETWYSPDLQVLVLSKTEDARMGETTYKLTNIQLSEPAPDLFESPSDYAVKDQPEPTVLFHDSKKLP
jgi:hypothetical protein